MGEDGRNGVCSSLFLRPAKLKINLVVHLRLKRLLTLVSAFSIHLKLSVLYPI